MYAFAASRVERREPDAKALNRLGLNIRHVHANAEGRPRHDVGTIQDSGMLLRNMVTVCPEFAAVQGVAGAGAGTGDGGR